MKKILMAVYNSIQNDARVLRAAETLYNNGYKIDIISFNSDINYKEPFFNSIIYNSHSKGYLNLLKFWYFVFKFITKNKRNYNILYLHDYYLPILGILTSKINKIKWVYDAHELLINKNNSKREKFFMFLEKISIRKADLVVTANEERKRVFNKIYRLKNLISVSNISQLNDYKDSIKEDLIVYQGILNKERMIDKFIDVMTLLPKNIKLKLIGEGDFDYLNDYIAKKNLSDRIILTGKLPYKRLMEESRKAKVGIVYYKIENLNTLYCSPNKLYEYVQNNITILGSPQPILKKVAENFNIGEIWDYRKEPIENLAKKLLLLINNYNIYRQNIPEFIKTYNYEKEMEKLSTAIIKLTTINHL